MRSTSELHARIQRVNAERHQTKTGLSRRRRRFLGDARKVAFSGGFDRLRIGTLDSLRERTTAGKEYHYGREDCRHRVHRAPPLR